MTSARPPLTYAYDRIQLNSWRAEFRKCHGRTQVILCFGQERDTRGLFKGSIHVILNTATSKHISMNKLVTFFAFSFSWHMVIAQPMTKTDYARAVSFLWDNVNNKKAFQLSVTPNWFADSTGFWYNQFSKDEKTFYKMTFKPLQKLLLFDHAQLAAKLNAVLKDPVDPKGLPLESLKYINSTQLEFAIQGKRFQWNSQTNALGSLPDKNSGSNELESRSPDGKWIAYTMNYNLFIRSVDSTTVKMLSSQGKKNYEYASYYGWSDIVEGEGGERPKRFVANWSKDSKWIQTSICDLRFGRKMYLLDWSVDTLYRARLLSYYRGSPGDTSVVHLIPIAFDITTGKEVKLDIPRVAHENGYGFEWMVKPGVALADYRERGFQKAHILHMNLNSGLQQIIFSDSSRTNIDGFDYWVSEKVNKIILTSERSGWKQLYTLDINTHVLKQLTTGEYFVNDIFYIDPTGEGTVYFLASGKEVGRNPYQQSLYSITMDGRKQKLLTPENGHHELLLSPNNLLLVDNYSTPQEPTTTVLRELKTGKVLQEISKADAAGLTAMKWSPPQPFTAIGKDGKSNIYGLLWKPVDFDATKKYPVIDNSYTGPHGQIVPRTFSRSLSSNNQALAELGFVVMMVDGLGTAGRSKAFHNYSYKRMGYNLEDHVRAIRKLSREFAWIDTSRVGIFGHSAGGYDAGHAMLQYPDFYKVAVASSADHDFRMEKAWWPEMYMGWPVDSAYHKQSNITMASKLKGKLLIVHGGIDENVNPSATFKMAEMLVRADKQFDMLILPSQRHGYAGPQQKYFTRKRWNYFVEHLLDRQPLWEFEWK